MITQPRTPEAAPLLVPQQKAAQLLHVSVRTIFNLRKQGALPTVHLGDKVLIRVTDIERLAASEGSRRGCPHSRGGEMEAKP